MRSRKLLLAGLFVCAIASSASGQVVINEIMYHPGSDEDGDEFIEIHNAGASPVDLSNWSMDGVLLSFQPGDTIAAGAYLVLGPAGGQTEATYGVAPFRTYDALTALDDNGERLALLDATLAVVDEVTYDDGPPWPVTPDGLGPSLELIDALEDNATPRNWHASTAPAGHTAGAANSVASVGLPPWIASVQHSPDPPQPDLDPIVVTATVQPVAPMSVELHYVIGADRPAVEVTLSMHDDGSSNDGAAGDGVWGLPTGGEIPAQPAGTPVRWRISVTGATGTMDYPRDDDTVDDYTNATCPGEPPCHLETDDTEPALLFFDGKLYDGAQVRVRGASSRNWLKKSWKFFFPQGHNFTAPGLIEQDVDTFNLQGNYSDKSFMRECLAWETLRDAGAPYLQTFPVRLERDGQFFGLYTYLEAPEADWLARMGLDPNGSRYKAFDDLSILSLDGLPDLYDPGDDQLHRGESDHARQRSHPEELLRLPGHGGDAALDDERLGSRPDVR
jgi:hypothetical protein